MSKCDKKERKRTKKCFFSHVDEWRQHVVEKKKRKNFSFKKCDKCIEIQRKTLTKL